MLRKLQGCLTLGCILVAPATLATATVGKPHSVIVCHSAVATREIRTYYSGNAGCHVDYVKNGTARTLWSADDDRNYCTIRANALATKLAHGNFTCSVPEPVPTNIVPKPARQQSAAGSSDPLSLTEAQIGAANRWLQQRVEFLIKTETVKSGPNAKRYSAKPDFLAAADLDADGKTDLVIGWGWASFRCDGTFLTVLINDASEAKPAYRPAEVQLPGNCGAKGWVSSVKDVKGRLIFIELQQRYPGADNVQRITAKLRHDGQFTFFDPAGRPGNLAAIEKALPMKAE